MEILTVLFWVAIILFGIFGSSKKKLETSQKNVGSKKPNNFQSVDYQALKKLVTADKPAHTYTEAFDFETFSEESKSQEVASTENIRQPRKNIEEQGLKNRQDKQAKPERSLPSIKSTKPAKPEKPKKVGKFEMFDEYVQHKAVKHPINQFMDDPANIRNAFILSEIFKKRFDSL